ncbi:hypothetical protein TG4357_00878 [Thalassovita gelatinovora]|uniref:Uncharacterized protein n=1 Tax=Thalassovita gelatinovora TaxID=53501 RepID=A0A0P1F721_THAGE|nr:DUF6476 family protein [Thalassovita gelatinovora]QIZ82241.1 hypothetical protein HFZ77_18040 [Thalassovita gelatinovora]CUH63767.1 hypothetical protein TG4357_00878 [Thalassovita gelatinovora]SEQ97991.1 hypothetical protein SAMN04488043_11274 [Thalassovita gelatinovora]
MDETPEPELPANLKFLRLLVTVLTGTMIVGLLVIITLIVIRFRDKSTDFPDAITLPDGTQAQAFTQTKRWYAVVTGEDHILVFSRETGKLVQDIEITAE